MHFVQTPHLLSNLIFDFTLLNVDDVQIILKLSLTVQTEAVYFERTGKAKSG